MKRRIPQYIPIILGLLFLYAGVAKLLHPGQATMALESLEIPFVLARWTIAGVTALELYLGTLLLLRINLKYALAVSTVVMLIFTAFLWYLSTLASPPACGCLGLTGIFENSRVEALVGVARNFAILAAIQWTYAYHFRTGNNRNSRPPVGPEGTLANTGM